MTNRATDVSAAVALLEAADPVDQDRLTADLGLSCARERVARLIAADAVGSGRSGSARRRRVVGARSKVTIAAVAAAAVAAVVAVVALDGGTPAVQSASAKTISAALSALTAPAGSILHVDATTTEITPGHPTYIWEQEVYEEIAPPYRARVIDKLLPGTPHGTEGVYGIGIGEQAYDPINNTIYDPTLPKPAPGSQSLTPAQEALLYEPYMAQYVRRLRAKLASGAARVDGQTRLDGRVVIKITFARSDGVDYVAADGSYVPIETIQGTPSSPDGQTTNVFHTFEFLPVAGNAKLLSLTAQHPSAAIDRSLADFRAVGKRLFSNG